MELSFERTAGAGTYRSECCAGTVRMTRGRLLPLCPTCREVTAWELLPAAPEPPPVRKRGTLTRFVRAEIE